MYSPEAYIPEALQLEVSKFFQSAAGQSYERALRARIPLSPDLGEQLHTIAAKYAYREGAEFMLTEVLSCWKEQDPNKHSDTDSYDAYHKILTNPQD